MNSQSSNKVFLIMYQTLTDGWTYTATVRLGNAQDVIMCGNHETSLSISSILVKKGNFLSRAPPAQLPTDIFLLVIWRHYRHLDV